MIKLEEVSKRYGEKTVVDRLSLDIPSGHLFAFIGPNGAGKTTTVKMMAGLLQLGGGRIMVDGHDIHKEHYAVKQIVSYIPDQPFLYDKLSGREFLLFVARMYGVSRADYDESLDKYSGLFQMSEYVDQLIETYSLGMRQRLIISAALMRKPRVVIVDEPLVGLDPNSTRTVKELFRQQVKDGVTIFMSTHLLSVAEEIADTIGLINEGKLVAQGTFAELKDKYQFQQSCRLEDIFMKATE
ncbi:MAG: ABC transporter ATP-binding protein [Candidatus Brocadiia bacterium]